MKKIIINASNLHVGGGVQVAVSLIEEIALLSAEGLDIEFTVFASSEVDANLRSNPSLLSHLARYEVFDLTGVSAFLSPNAKKFREHDVCFNVFGPTYVWSRCKYNVSGFAQPWIIYPDTAAYSFLPAIVRFTRRLKFLLQQQAFRFNDRLIVEAPHVKKRLGAVRQFRTLPIDVVENCCSSIFLDNSRWGSLALSQSNLDPSCITLGFLGAGYMHKNLRILKRVDELLRTEFGLKCNFLFSLDSASMSDHGFDELLNFESVGTILSEQCPGFYKHIDALVFPSLLECFSATPIEAMIMRKPVFASDLPFVRDVCGDHAFYFNPLDAYDIARVIAAGLSSIFASCAITEGAYRYAMSLPNAKDRAKKTIEILAGCVTTGN